MSELVDKQKILVVDDTSENIDILMGILKSDYKMIAARNGEKALTLANGENPPGLILLDVMMPGMDGYEVCRRLKANEITKKIPVIFVTAKNEVEDETLGLGLGAVDYIVKPISPPIVKARIKNHIELKLARESLETLAEKLSRYLSPQIYATIFSGERDVKIESDSKYLTIFFSDIAGFTPKTESMEPQELTRWLNNYLNEMNDISIRHGGTWDKFIGDSVMVFFGGPKSEGPENDAIKCVQMAFEMQLRARQMEIELRIGINSGECTVGNFGSVNHLAYTIIGNPVNAASRLEQSSENGKIQISDVTYNLIKEKIPCEPRGEMKLKGIEKEMMTYWALGNNQQ